MKIGVILKQVFDTETKILLKDDYLDVIRDGVKYIINPYDEYAVEEALRIKEKLADNSETTIITCAPKRATEALRTALAMGIDRGIHVVGENFDYCDSYVTGKILARVLNDEKFDLILGGKQAVDDDCSQVCQITAEFLNIPHATVVLKIELSPDKQYATVQREIEGASREVIQMKLPCVVGVTKGINEPRYASLPGIMKAKKKEIKEYTIESLGFSTNFIEEEKKIKILKYSLPQARSKGKIIGGELNDAAIELVKLLREEAKVI
jgi:electron transfer flavoprotein beta subunit